MRFLRKLVIKLITLAVIVVVMGAAARYARPYIMKSAGVPEGMSSLNGVEAPRFASEESDLMATVFKSALRLFSGSAKREELASELSDKLYANRGGSATMSELGIELEKPGAKPSDPAVLTKSGAVSSISPAVTSPAKSQADGKSPAKSPQPNDPQAKNASNPVQQALLDRIMEKAKLNPELTLIPIVLLGMLVFRLLFRRRRSPADDLMMPDFSKLIPSEAEEYTMTHKVHSLSSEDFELLVGLIYQRQGYRVTMPAGLSGGRGGDFMVQRKSERLLVQCKKLNPDDKVHVDRVRELQEAAAAAGATRGVYVASCSFSWDARNFAKTKGVTVINAKTLDLLLDEARETPDEDFLAVSQWAPKLMSKVKLTPPFCPACEASMEELNVSSGSVWVCSQRPECRGRRTARKKTFKSMPAAASTPAAAPAKTPTPTPPREEWQQPESRGGRARTICPATA
ncbi:MAG: restriction endonuclease [Chthoniobacterales bacterium]